jgi:FkbM family methyltransferase
MREGLLKTVLRRTLFQPGAVRPIVAGPLRGYRFRVDSVTGMAPLYSGPERHEQAFIASRVRSGDTTFDVGANWGVHTLLLARLVGPQGHVTAIEPFPAALDSLRWHVAHNHCDRVTIVDAGASDVDATGWLAEGANAMESHLTSEGGGRPVTLHRLDTLWTNAGRPRVAFIKVDVEGVEAAVLRGASSIIDRDRPAMLVALDGSFESSRNLTRDLARRGYRMWRVQDGKSVTAFDEPWPHPNGPYGGLCAVAT